MGRVLRAAGLCVCGVLCAGGMLWGQAGPAAVPTTTVKSAPPTYIKSNTEEISRAAGQYEGRYVQLADLFGARVERFPAELMRQGVTAQTHLAFRTHRALGSNALCVIPRENKEGEAFFETPLTAEMEIYIMGKVGPRVDAGDAVVPVIFLDRVVRGSTPPPPIKVEEKKTLSMTVEKVVGGKYVRVQEYKFPESGKRYMIDDPYDPNRKIYVTFQF